MNNERSNESGNEQELHVGDLVEIRIGGTNIDSGWHIQEIDTAGDGWVTVMKTTNGRPESKKYRLPNFKEEQKGIKEQRKMISNMKWS